jgi:hypothetical protein
MIVLDKLVYCGEPKAVDTEANELVGNCLGDACCTNFKHSVEETLLYSNRRLARRLVAMARPLLH